VTGGEAGPGDAAVPAVPAGEPRFTADAMLGRLARWLRVLGFDTAYGPTLDDRRLVEQAAAERRVVLTRDRHLVAHLRPERAILVTRDAPLEQLRQVLETCDLRIPRDLFTRCLVCNVRLRPATREEIAALVPPGARSMEVPVLCCSTCGRVYWPGSHVRRMRAALQGSMPELIGFDEPVS
jgi:uncharacterized protein